MNRRIRKNLNTGESDGVVEGGLEPFGLPSAKTIVEGRVIFQRP
jgi:hypothetical protein